MRKNTLLVLTILAVLAFSCQVVWAGDHHIKEVSLPGGVKAYQYDQTNFFGQDYSGTTIVGPQSQQPPILRLQSGSITESTTTTTFSRCKERAGDGRLTQAYFVGEEKKVVKQAGFQDAVNPANGQPPWIASIGGSGPSTGNMAVPALISGGAFVGGNAVAPGTNIALTAVAKGGKQIQGQGQGSRNININPNTNTNPITIGNTINP